MNALVAATSSASVMVGILDDADLVAVVLQELVDALPNRSRQRTPVHQDDFLASAMMISLRLLG